MRERYYFVYIMASKSRCLYVGVTNNLERRVREHQSNAVKSFTSRYNIHHLVYFETHNDIRAAIAREKQIKGLRREKKTALIEAVNPEWRDLSQPVDG